MADDFDQILRHLPHPIADRCRLLPADWTLNHLDSLVADDSPICYGILMPGEDHENGVPVIKVKNFHNGKISASSLLRTTNEIDHEYRRSRVRTGDVLLSIRGSVGELAVAEADIDGANITQDTARIRLNGEANHWYVFYALRSSLVQQQIDMNTIGQAVRGINISEVRRLVIPAPPLPEQQKIAAILSTWDRAIELTEKLIAAKQKRKQALMQQLLTGKVRLPRYKGQKWQLGRIGQFLTESRIAGSDGENAKKITVKLYGKGVLPKSESRKGSSATQYYRRSAGQFIYSKLDFLNGAFGIIPTDMDGFESTLDLPAFDINGQLDSRWFLGFVSREPFYSRGFSLANGGRKARRVNPRDFLNIKIKLPSLPEQRAIADVLETAEQETQYLAQKLNALKLQKKGLMQQLLTGRVRLSNEFKVTVEVNT